MKQNLRQDLQAIQQQLMAGRFQEGVGLCRQVLSYAPNEPNALYMMGVAAAQLGDANGTRAAFDAALKVTPNRIDLLVNYGNFLRETGALERALQLLQRASELAPTTAGVWQSLSSTQFRLERFAEALKSAEKLVSLLPTDAAAWELAAGAAQRLRHLDRAVQLIRSGLEKLPEAATLHYALGQLSRERGDFEAANGAYERARQLGFTSAELFRNNAEALLELGRPLEAAAFAREGLAHYPTDIALHQVATRLHVESRTPGDPVGELIKAARSQQTNAALWETAIGFLKYLDRSDDEQKLLREALSSGSPKTPRLLSLEAIAQADAGNKDQMMSTYERLLNRFPDDASVKFDFAIQLLKASVPERANQLFDEVLKESPLDQMALGFKSTALRLMGDDRLNDLVDHEAMVFKVDVPAPDGYASRAEYFAEVAAVLESLHHTHAHPIDQSVRGGTQTNGFLFRIAHPVVKQLEQQIRLAVVEAFKRFPTNSAHPFWQRHVAGTRAADIVFSGAWSVRLSAQGFHTNHMHPKGWISSALYIAVPDEVIGGTDDAGYIQFGAPEDKLGLDLPPIRTVKPEVGSLVLFPSYMWHGTIPFSSEQPRITVAFDIVPHSE
ncbi:Tfp pilus assembly protein PilF [gamma proteobacterium HIMB55]|nr:Tfp pilus assembly protein PilF [gamma proteobacterium HIMB55]